MQRYRGRSLTAGIVAIRSILAFEQVFVYGWWMPTTVPGQRSFDDLGSPLHEVTFVVVDLETTGGSPTTCGITEVGAVKLRGGECLGTFQTLVNPGLPIPPQITVITGITQAMVIPAPPIDEVLPALLEFIGGAIVVGHNVRFDLSFLREALQATDRPRLDNRSIDTVRPRPSARARRGAQPQARHARVTVPLVPHPRPIAPSTTRWPPATSFTSCSNAPPGSG